MDTPRHSPGAGGIIKPGSFAEQPPPAFPFLYPKAKGSILAEETLRAMSKALELCCPHGTLQKKEANPSYRLQQGQRPGGHVGRAHPCPSAGPKSHVLMGIDPQGGSGNTDGTPGRCMGRWMGRRSRGCPAVLVLSQFRAQEWPGAAPGEGKKAPQISEKSPRHL